MNHANARRLAYDILYRIEKERSYADILINNELSTGRLEGPDRSLLTELVYGTLRRRGTLDHIINQFSKRSNEKLERSVLQLLRLGLYQLLYLDRIPASAAVNETVALAHALAPRAAGFINAVLRQADRNRAEIRYPEKGSDPSGYLAARYSHPRWLTEQWCRQLGYDEAEKLADTMSAPPPFTIRVNSLKTTRAKLIERLSAEGISATSGRYAPTAVQVTGPISLAALPSFREGLFTVQDEASQLASIFLDPAPGESVLDLCAAPGGKTSHLAQIMQNTGFITACDATPRKLRLVSETAERLGINIITTKPLDASASPLPLTPESFDRVLLDAPCSGLGVLRRNPEGKWWKSPQTVAELAVLQKALLQNASCLVKKEGVILYATCSTTREENEAVITDFLSSHPHFVVEDLRLVLPEFAELSTPEGYFRSWPHRHVMDGFFAARLKKTK